MIKDLYIMNFRNVEGKTYSFGRGNFIFGSNGQGKTTIAEAIIWCLFGCDLTGKTKQEGRLMRHGTTDEMSVGVRMVIKNQTVTIERTKPVDGPEVLKVNGKKSGQGAAAVWVGDKDVFLSAFWPGYFGSLEPKEARKVLAELLPMPSVQDVLKKLTPGEAQALEGLEKDLLDFEHLLDLKRKEQRGAEQELALLEGRAHEAQEAANRKLLTFEKEKEDELNRLERFLIQARQQQPPSSASLESLEQVRQTLLNQYRQLQKMLKPISKELVCEACGQPITADKRADLNKTALEHNSKIQEKLQAVLEEGKRIKKEIERIQADSKPTSNDFAISAEEISAAEEKRNALLAERARVEAENRVIKEAQLRLAQLLQEIRQRRAHANRLAAQIQALVSYRIQFSELQITPLLEHLQHMKLDLYDINKQTGEVKPVFRLSWNGIPYRSLSTSEKVRCDVEIHNMICAVTGEPIPMFIDNAEGVQNLGKERIQNQVFAAYVRHGDLVVETTGQSAEEKTA